MPSKLKITRPRARLEAHLHPGPTFSRGIVLRGYETRRTNGRWWQRTIHATDNQWLRLSGREGTSPADTWRMILDARTRPVLSLPVLLLADFVTHGADVAAPDARWPLQWVVWGLDELFQLHPPPVTTSAAPSMSGAEIDATVQDIVETLLDGTESFPWPASDTDQLRTFAALGAYLWSFPPDTVRRIIDLTIATPKRASVVTSLTEDEASVTERIVQRAFAGPGILAQLSGVHIWRTTDVTVRGLPIDTSSLYFLKVIQQALVLTHPDAPRIDNADLARLCDGALHNLSPQPFGDLSQTRDSTSLSSFSRSASHAQIIEWSQESAEKAMTHPTHLEYTALPDNPLFGVLGLRALRLVSSPEGLWVRLLPQEDSWGNVFWWLPRIEPPSCLAFVLGIEREHSLVWVVHEALWRLWGDQQQP